jgi:hypothetical protein
MSARTILGIDPGAHGAIAMLDETGQLLELEDMRRRLKQEVGPRLMRLCLLVSSLALMPMSSIANLSVRARLMRRSQRSALGARKALSKAPVARSRCRSSS